MVTAEKKEELIEQISSRTEINKEVIVDLFKLFSDVKYNVNAKSKDLVKLYQALENFNNIKK
jgi:predicted site-specific integrase-resolvase